MPITYEDFEKVDIRLGKIIKIEDFPEAKKPAYKLWVDFGPEIGTKTSSAGLPGAHTKEEVLGMFVACVINFPPKQIGPFVSEVLTLGFKNTAGDGWVLVTPSKLTVKLGDKLR